MDKGDLSAGAGTRRIEYGAESVLDLDVDKDAKEDANGEKPVMLRAMRNIIVQSHMGAESSIDSDCSPRCAIVVEADQQMAPTKPLEGINVVIVVPVVPALLDRTEC